MPVDLSSDEEELRRNAREFGDEHVEPHVTDYATDPRWPWPIHEEAAAAGLVGLRYGEEYGGREASVVEECIVAEEFTRADSNIGIALYGATTGCTVLSYFATDAQKERWLAPVLRGEATNSIALTEPDTGSDMSAVSTTAERDGDEWVVNGEKKWIANGKSGSCTTTLCVTDPDAEPRHRGLSLVAVPPETDGYEARELNKLGLDAAEHARVEYDGVRVPAGNLLGEEGEGFYQTLAWLKPGRVTIAAAHLGMAAGAFDRALDYATEREQGGQPIGDYQGLRWTLADMKTKIETARAQVYRAARLVDAEEHGEQVAENVIEQVSIAKLHATEIAVEVASDAVQIHGGSGYEVETGIEHFYRDAKAGTIYEGTSEVQRNTIGKVLFGEF